MQPIPERPDRPSLEQMAAEVAWHRQWRRWWRIATYLLNGSVGGGLGLLGIVIGGFGDRLRLAVAVVAMSLFVCATAILWMLAGWDRTHERTCTAPWLMPPALWNRNRRTR